MTITVVEPSLVVLIGPSGSGKSTFAARHFGQTEVISSDECRALVADDANNQAATAAAFRILHAIARERVRRRRMTVIDATNVQPRSRKPLLALGLKHGIAVVAIVFSLPEQLCVDRNSLRSQRSLPADVIHRQYEQMRHSLPGLEGEGFAQVNVLDSAEAAESATVRRVTI